MTTKPTTPPPALSHVPPEALAPFELEQMTLTFTCAGVGLPLVDRVGKLLKMAGQAYGLKCINHEELCLHLDKHKQRDTIPLHETLPTTSKDHPRLRHEPVRTRTKDGGIASRAVPLRGEQSRNDDRHIGQTGPCAGAENHLPPQIALQGQVR